uniref:DH domain-containing protein n=1 Tax=Mesocestoides corti TaxID=53468 RepID=A0A5K3F3H3_MESCO
RPIFLLLAIDSQSKVVRKIPSQLFKRKLWNIESVSSSSSTGNPNASCGIPYNTGRRRTPSAPSKTPTTPVGQTAILRRNIFPQSLVDNEVCQARAMILMVQEELVNTENSYVHILSQFLILRDEIFAPGWRNDRQKFIRLFPAAVDDLCNLHRESFEAMRRAFDSSINEARPWKEGWTKDYLHQIPTYREETGVGEGGRFTCNATPFTVLLEMLEGKRPLGCYTHSNCTSYYRNAPFWSTAPFFKLYARYLAEFSSAMHMLNKMRRGSSRLRKHLTQLQMHPACEFNDITTYLLAPVQRLPRYLLLVKKMIYYTRKLEPSDLNTVAKRSRPKVGLRRTVTPTNHFTTSLRFPHLDSLRRAEAALHGMLLELDEMIGSEVADFKAVGRDVTAIDGVKATPSYSNNCSDSLDGNSSPNTLSFNTPMLTNTEEKASNDTDGAYIEKKNTEGGGFWKRLKSLRLTFTAKEANQEKFSGILDDVGTLGSPITPCANTLPVPKPTPVSLREGSRRSLSQSPRTQSTAAAQRAQRLGMKDTNGLEKTGEPQPLSWRRASSARPLSYSQPKKPTSLSNRRIAHQKQEHDTRKLVERKHSWRSLPNHKRPQNIKNHEPSGKKLPTRDSCIYSGEGGSKSTEPHPVPLSTRPVKRNNRYV